MTASRRRQAAKQRREQEREEELESLADAISRAKRQSGLTYRQISARCGRDMGHRLRSGQCAGDLRVSTLLDICAATGYPA